MQDFRDYVAAIWLASILSWLGLCLARRIPLAHIIAWENRLEQFWIIAAILLVAASALARTLRQVLPYSELVTDIGSLPLLGYIWYRVIHVSVCGRSSCHGSAGRGA